MTQRADRWAALCYHDVLPEATAAGGGPQRFDVPLASFELMLDTIAEANLRGCSVAEALAAPGTGRVAITFDDGNVGQFEHAAPALRARGMTATFYVTTDWVGRPGFVSWDQLRQLKAWGMSVQSHSRSHPFLSELDAAALERELADSRARLDAELAQTTTEIAFPGGDPPRRALRRMLADAGYTVALGTRWGMNDDSGADPRRPLKRCTVRGATDPAWAERVIRGDAALSFHNWPRESLLRSIRSSLGPTRYSRWRRWLLDRVSR
jgi:peptidoglycan/xylan/chitin deacetylase (PgdA/CDA1 family)